MTIRELTRDLLGRRPRRRDEQYAILLGKACAREAGKPYEQVIQKMAGQAANQVPGLGSIPGSLGPKLSGMLAHAASNADTLPEKLLASVPEALRGSVEQTMYRLLRQYYVNLPVPLFYQDLGAMLKAGYFSRVLTTNYDNLLEQALDNPPTPLRRDRDYFVINVPALKRTDLKQRLVSLDKDSLLILKLHGDLLQEGNDFDLADVESALIEHRRAMYGELSDDLVVVGYERESPGVDKALQAQSGGVVWWINENGLDSSLQSALSAVRTVNIIDGPGSAPQQFFGTLWTMLSRAPDVAIRANDPSVDQAAETHTECEDALSSDGLDPIMLSDRLARAQDELERLRQSSPPGTNPDVEAQIEYQKLQISDLEDQIRLQHKDKILTLLTQLSLTTVDAEVKDFVGKQAAVISQQLDALQPNQHVISAAIAAITVLARRLGESIAPAGTVRALSSFVPSAIGRGI
jgi:hypothetical protein